MPEPTLTVRAAGTDDSRTLQLLAWLTGGSRVPRGRALLAERGGVPVAAIALTSAAMLADLSNAMRDVVSALTLTRYRILRQGGQTGAARSLLARGV